MSVNSRRLRTPLVNPSREVGARHETVLRHQRLGRHILRKVIRRRTVSCQCQCPDAHLWEECGKLFVKLVRHSVSPGAQSVPKRDASASQNVAKQDE
jgi:hypothetical protein